MLSEPNPKITAIAKNALRGRPASREEAEFLMGLDGEERHELLFWANRVRAQFKGDLVTFCSIISAKQGACSEDCRFCSQSARHRTEIETFPLLAEEELTGRIHELAGSGCDSVGIVTSGRGPTSDEEWSGILTGVAETSLACGGHACASLGVLTEEQAKKLREAGLVRYNHNLETSRSFFPQICTTHTYDDRLATVRIAKRAGLEVCCGGIFGMGESVRDRVELAMGLRELDVDSIPLNFLNPIPGTPLENAEPLSPMEILGIVATYRLMFPDKEIKICGGREANLRDLQSWMFYAGANGAILGNYLTTTGRKAEDDLQMIKDLGLRAVRHGDDHQATFILRSPPVLRSAYSAEATKAGSSVTEGGTKAESAATEGGTENGENDG